MSFFFFSFFISVMWRINHFQLTTMEVCFFYLLCVLRITTQPSMMLHLRTMIALNLMAGVLVRNLLYTVNTEWTVTTIDDTAGRVSWCWWWLWYRLGVLMNKWYLLVCTCTMYVVVLECVPTSASVPSHHIHHTRACFIFYYIGGVRPPEHALNKCAMAGPPQLHEY